MGAAPDCRPAGRPGTGHHLVAAGQAAFTLTLLVLFNLLVPVGWKIGLVRVEDVAIGGTVSLAGGLLLWPRGAAAALGQALSQAYLQSAAYLAGAVAYGVGRCDASGPSPEPPVDQARQAAAASRRLEDTFRGYLAERGSKPIPLAQVTSLVTSVAGVRLAADALLDLWDGDARSGDRAAVRHELLSATTNLTGWYRHFAASLAGEEAVPDPLIANQVADGRLVDAVARDLRDTDGRATATGVKVIWTGDHLDAVRSLQETLIDPAVTAVSQHALRPKDEILTVLSRDGCAGDQAPISVQGEDRCERAARRPRRRRSSAALLPPGFESHRLSPAGETRGQ